MAHSLKILIITVLFFNIQISKIYAQKSDSLTHKKQKISFKDPIDGAFDISQFLLNPKGFYPLPIMITEPALGYGGGVSLLFFSPQKKKHKVYVPPNITGVIGAGTSNKTWMAGLFHFHVFGADKVRYLGFVGKPSINIKYFGNNNDFISKNPVQFNLDSWTLIQRVNARVGDSRLFVGGTYMFFQGETTFDPFPDTPVLNNVISKLDGKSTISMLKPMVNWDSRNNIFTPVKGFNGGLEFTYSATWLGSDDNYYQISPFFYGYKKISTKILSSWRFDANFLINDAPFYAKPFIQLRGVPMMKYQSNNTVVVETEWKFKVHKRWSLDVFGGTGKAFKSFNEVDNATLVYNYGLGFRYNISRLFGIDVGADFAWSNEQEFGFYIIFGSAWNR